MTAYNAMLLPLKLYIYRKILIPTIRQAMYGNSSIVETVDTRICDMCTIITAFLKTFLNKDLKVQNCYLKCKVTEVLRGWFDMSSKGVV